MKLYDHPHAPSPRRVHIFLAEKDNKEVEIEFITIDLRNGEQFTEEFRKKNPACTVPVLELDDGTYLSESIAICRYLEFLFPTPILMGQNPKEAALISMWNRRVEFDIYWSVAHMLRNSFPRFSERALPGFEKDIPQISPLVDRSRKVLVRMLSIVEEQLKDTNAYLIGDHFSIADITLFIAIDFAIQIKAVPLDKYAALHRWYEEVSARPSISE